MLGILINNDRLSFNKIISDLFNPQIYTDVNTSQINAQLGYEVKRGFGPFSKLKGFCCCVSCACVSTKSTCTVRLNVSDVHCKDYIR